VREQKTHPNQDVRCDQIDANSQQCSDLPPCSGASLVVDAGGGVRSEQLTWSVGVGRSAAKEVFFFLFLYNARLELTTTLRYGTLYM